MRAYRSAYPKPWLSIRGLSRLLGVHPGDIHRARDLGLMREGHHFKLASTTSAGKRLLVFHYDRVREDWPRLKTMVSESYRLGLLQFRRKLSEDGVAGSGRPAAHSPVRPRRYPINEVGPHAHTPLPVIRRPPLCWADEHVDELERVGILQSTQERSRQTLG